MLDHRRARLAASALCLTLAGSGAAVTVGGARAAVARAPIATATQAGAVTWTGLRHLTRVIDLAGPNAQGTIVAIANGRLDALTSSGSIHRFAPGYSVSAGLEVYITMSSGQHVSGAGCSWPAGDLYALDLSSTPGVSVVTPQGSVSHLASLPTQTGLENGITFDTTGRFGHRLLITSTISLKTTSVYAISCNGQVQVLTRHGPRVEGGMVVAPPGFGRFGGDLLAADEYSGNLYAFAPDGRASVVVHTNIPTGRDTGIEGLGVVPATYAQALVSDRSYPPDRSHPGDNLILHVTQAALSAAGVRPGEVLAVAEAGARTAVISCGATACHARDIGHGPHAAHVEGHVAFSNANL